MTIEAEGTAEQIEAYFGTPLAQYEVGEETVRLASSPLSAPAQVAPLISGVRGVNEVRAKPANLTGGPGDGGHGPGDGTVTVTAMVHGWPPEPGRRSRNPAARSASATRLPAPPTTGRSSPSTLPDFGDGFPNPLPYAVCGYKPAQLQGAYNLASADRPRQQRLRA